MDLPSRLDLFANGRDYVLQRAKKIDPAQVNILGSDINIFVGSTSVVAYALVLQLGYSINRLLLDGAEDEDLDRYAYDRYSIVRKGASPALGAVEFGRATATAGAGTIKLGTKLATLTGVEYITITEGSFTASGLTATCNVRAVQAGKFNQVGANGIRRFSDITTVFDQTITVNNANPTAGGEDAEEDDTFRDRIRDFWNSARRGTLGAIEFGARTVPGVESARAEEALTAGAFPARVVNLYVSDGSGVASAALGNTVRTSLDEYRAGGIAVIISQSIPQIVTIKLKLRFQAGVDSSALTELVKGAVFEFVNSLPVNGTLYHSALVSVLQRYVADGLIVDDATLVEPVGDLIADVGRTLRTLTSEVQVTA